MVSTRTFTITGLHGDGDGGTGVTLYRAVLGGEDVVIAALSGQFSRCQEYTASLARAGQQLFNGQTVDYMAQP